MQAELDEQRAPLVGPFLRWLAVHLDDHHVAVPTEIRRGGGEHVRLPAGMQQSLAEHAIVQSDAQPVAGAGVSSPVTAWSQDEAELAHRRVDTPESQLARRPQEPHTMVLPIRFVR